MAAFRAIENGVSVVQATRYGRSSAGRNLAQMNEAAAEQLANVAQIPVNGVRTNYARVGDAIAWLCAAGLAVSFFWAVLR